MMSRVDADGSHMFQVAPVIARSRGLAAPDRDRRRRGIAIPTYPIARRRYPFVPAQPTVANDSLVTATIGRVRRLAGAPWILRGRAGRAGPGRAEGGQWWAVCESPSRTRRRAIRRPADLA